MANISRNAELNLVTFNKKDLQMELFQIYVTGQSKMAVAVAKNSENIKMTNLKSL